MKEYIHVKDNKYKIPYTRKNGKASNRYYIKTECNTCGAEMYQHNSNHIKHNGRGYCSVVCSNKVKSVVDGTTKKKRGVNSKDLHMLTKQEKHPNSIKGWVPTHRLIVEKELGRYLLSTEIVHHIDMKADNNNVGNLYLCENTTEHNLAHGSINTCIAELIEMKVLKFKKGRYYVDSNSGA